MALEQTKEQTEALLPEQTKEQIEALLRTEFRAFVYFNGGTSSPTISELLEPRSKFWKNISKKKRNGRTSDWIWFHLPAVNVRPWLQFGYAAEDINLSSA